MLQWLEKFVVVRIAGIKAGKLMRPQNHASKAFAKPALLADAIANNTRHRDLAVHSLAAGLAPNRHGKQYNWILCCKRLGRVRQRNGGGFGHGLGASICFKISSFDGRDCESTGLLKPSGGTEMSSEGRRKRRLIATAATKFTSVS